MPVEDYLPERQTIWDEVEHNVLSFFMELRDRGDITEDDFIREVNIEIGPLYEEVAEKELLMLDAEQQLRDALFEKQKGFLRGAFREVLVSLWKWTIEQLKALIDLVVGVLRPVLQKAWEFAQAKFEDAGRTIYDGTQKLFEGHSPMRPEDAPALAVKLYTFAMGAGMAAHGAAVATELLHPLKRIGLHQTAALISDFAGFGRICGATMGPLVNKVLGQLMTYNVLNRFRPVIPDESLLIELRSKREIDKPTFDEAMAYQGFNKDWIDVIERWQWKDPRMFELMRVADVGIDQGPVPSGEMWWFKKFGVTGEMLKDWWLYRKLMRAGYEDCDLPVLIRTIHRREYAFAITYVRTAIRRNYRWGYLTDEDLDRWMEKMGLPKKAMEWIHWAGDLDKDYFYRRDLENHYVLAFRNDVIDEDELTVSLLAMGLPARHVVLSVRTEKVRKSPKVSTPVSPAAKKAMTELQKKSITLYITQYRKDLITSEKLLESLLAIGLSAELAEISVDIEAAKKGLPEPV